MGALSARDPLARIPAALRAGRHARASPPACSWASYLSLSRMGVVSTLAAVAGVLAALAFGLPRRRRWLWLVPIAVPLLILASLSTRELLLRFADLTATQEISQDMRVRIWTDTLHVMAAYRWTGCGLGAYERGMYQFKTAAPTNTVDYAHNDYLQMAAELGIPGMLLMAALAVWVLRRTLTVVVCDARQPELAAGLRPAGRIPGHRGAQPGGFQPLRPRQRSGLCVAGRPVRRPGPWPLAKGLVTCAWSSPSPRS